MFVPPPTHKYKFCYADESMWSGQQVWSCYFFFPFKLIFVFFTDWLQWT